MVKKFGGEFELKDVEIKTSTIEARKLFLKLIWEMKPDVVIDLIRLFNFESIPTEWQNEPKSLDTCRKLFLLHTQYHQCYSIDLTELGFKSDVRNTPFLAYFDFLLKNQSEFDDLLKKGEEYWEKRVEITTKKTILDWASERFIPDWNTLKSKSGSEWLCKTLTDWSEKWNLSADWCFDFALECLRICKIDLIDEFQIPTNYLNINAFQLLRRYSNFWQGGFAWRSALSKQIWKIQNNYSILKKISNYPEFNYVWGKRTEDNLNDFFEIKRVYFPLTLLKEQFREQVEKEFWEKFFDYYKYRQHLLIGDFDALSDKLKNFDRKLDNYISKVKATVKPFVNKPVIKKDGDKHFRWFIEYQIPPVKSYTKISLEHNVDNKAVRVGIADVSKIIQLELTKAKRTGRPKGVHETKERNRYSSW